MNNDDNNSLFNMFGTEEKEKPVVEKPPVPEEPTPKPEENKPPVTTPPVPQIPVKEEQKSIPEAYIPESTVTQEQLVKLYIGPRLEKFERGGFSFPTFFFGLYHLLYRKQNIYLVPFLGITLAVRLLAAYNLIMPASLLSVLYFVFLIYVSVTFRSSYMRQAQETAAQILQSKVSDEEKKQAAKSLGGVSVKGIVAAMLLYTIVYFAANIVALFGSTTTQSDYEIHFPEAFKPYQINAAKNQTEYKIGKYTYAELVFNIRDSDNVCNYHIYQDDEHIKKENKEENIVKNYLKDKHDLEIKEDIKEVEQGGKTYYYYYEEKEKVDHYFMITEKSFTEIETTYIKDQNKKCHEWTEYILKNSKISK